MKKINKIDIILNYGDEIRHIEVDSEKLIQKYNILNNLINEIEEYIDHELNHHILKYDEETWNKEFYTDNKLDYRKLLIGILNDILRIIRENKEEINGNYRIIK